jgi:hypothetical protein
LLHIPAVSLWLGIALRELLFNFCLEPCLACGRLPRWRRESLAKLKPVYWNVKFRRNFVVGRIGTDAAADSACDALIRQWRDGPRRPND